MVVCRTPIFLSEPSDTAGRTPERVDISITYGYYFLVFEK